MSDHAENLKNALATELNIAPLREAFHTWIDAIEERFSEPALPDPTMATLDDHLDLADRVSALEKAVADLHAALSSAPTPVTVQRAVENLEPPVPAP